jgi:hypothetical protein
LLANLADVIGGVLPSLNLRRIVLPDDFFALQYEFAQKRLLIEMY